MPRAAVVGAGIAGLSAAILLRRSGWSVRVLERASEPSPIGSGLLLQPPGLAVLGRMGLLDRMLEQGARITGLEGRTRSGRSVIALDYAKWEPGCYGLGVHRGALWHLLHETALADGVAVEGGVEVEDADAFRGCDLGLVTSGSRTALRKALGFGDPIDNFFDLSTWVAAVIGSIVLLVAYRAIAGRSHGGLLSH